MLTEAGFAVALSTDATQRTSDSADTYRALKHERFLKGMIVEAHEPYLQRLACESKAAFIYVPLLPQGFENRELVRAWSLSQKQPRPLIIGGRAVPIKDQYYTHISPDAILLYAPFGQPPLLTEVEQAQRRLEKLSSKHSPTLVECVNAQQAQEFQSHTDGIIIKAMNNVWTPDEVSAYTQAVHASREHVDAEFASEFYR